MLPIAHPLATELTATSFLGPYTRSAGQDDAAADPKAADASRQQRVFMTIGHWWHAAKFMPRKPQLRDELIETASVVQAYNFAQKRKADWRTDWEVIRHNVLVCGLGMLALQRPELQLQSAPLDDIAEALAPLRLPKSFVRSCLPAFDAWRTAPKIAVFGADAPPDHVVSKRIAKIIEPLPAWTLLLPVTGSTAWRLHDWSLYQFKPVQYFGTPGKRLGRKTADAMVLAADQVVVFERRGDKRFDHVIALARSRKRKLVLELFDQDGEATRQLSITWADRPTLAARPRAAPRKADQEPFTVRLKIAAFLAAGESDVAVTLNSPIPPPALKSGAVAMPFLSVTTTTVVAVPQRP